MEQSPPRSRFELDQLFHSLFKQIVEQESLEDETLMAKVQQCAQGVALQGVISSNEEFDDIDTLDLGFLLVDFWLGMLHAKEQHVPFKPDLRLESIQRARVYFDRYRRRFRTLGLQSGCQDGDDDDDDDDDEQGPFKSKPKDVRSIKIARFQAKRALEEELENETDVRERWRIRLGLAHLASMEEMDAIDKEIVMLKMMLTTDPHQPSPSSTAKATPAPPLQVTHVGADFQVKRQYFEKGVFKPYHRLPTVSLEEYAEHEMKKLEEQQARAKQAQEEGTATRVMSLDEILEKGLEDDQHAFDGATEKARYWDDYKDSVPKGSGVTKRI